MSILAQAQEHEIAERNDVADAMAVVEDHGRIPGTLEGLERARVAMGWRLEANAHKLNAVLAEYRANYALSDEIDRRIAHHSVLISDRYVDNTMTLCRLRRRSGRPPDYI
jgi:hypothetical protein